MYITQYQLVKWIATAYFYLFIYCQVLQTTDALAHNNTNIITVKDKSGHLQDRFFGDEDSVSSGVKVILYNLQNKSQKLKMTVSWHSGKDHHLLCKHLKLRFVAWSA